MRRIIPNGDFEVPPHLDHAHGRVRSDFGLKTKVELHCRRAGGRRRAEELHVARPRGTPSASMDEVGRIAGGVAGTANLVVDFVGRTWRARVAE